MRSYPPIFAKVSDSWYELKFLFHGTKCCLRFNALFEQENFPILSDSWFEMTEVFGRMATISDMESKLSAGKDDAATLWETEEQALRFLLEDGKLNLCLRSLVEFKQAQITARKIGKGPMVRFTQQTVNVVL
jgi:hypothetical protein